jgi:UDPglucose 6-dehydrogenase
MLWKVDGVTILNYYFERNMKKVAMIGVGKLGQDCAEVMSDAGYEVVGYDIDPKFPAFPMKASIEEAVQDRDFIFIAAPTPHDPIYGGETPTSHLPNKDFDYTIVIDILTEVNKYVNKSQLVVLISTVLPGTVRNHLEPCITNARFIYNPYLIAMGTIKWDMVNPEMVIIGTEDGSVTGDASELINFYKVFMQNNPRYEIGTWDEAEAIKIFYNTFISTKLALVNMVQDVAETNGNMNVDIVTQALAKSTHRIMGPAYMKAGLGDAGACHPRDNIALRYLAERLDLGYDLFDGIMTAREKQAERMAQKCLRYGKNVTIIGKAYKPRVPYLNGSASMLVGYYIEKHGGIVHYYDLNTGDNDLRQEWTEVYLIGYWEEWVDRISLKNAGCVLIDPWRKAESKHHTGEIIHYGNTRRTF